VKCREPEPEQGERVTVPPLRGRAPFLGDLVEHGDVEHDGAEWPKLAARTLETHPRLDRRERLAAGRLILLRRRLEVWLVPADQPADRGRARALEITLEPQAGARLIGADLPAHQELVELVDVAGDTRPRLGLLGGRDATLARGKVRGFLLSAAAAGSGGAAAAGHGPEI